MAVFLTIHARYKDVQWGLFRDTTLVEAVVDENKHISKNFITMLDSLLKKNKFDFSELSFIAAHQGPAPFTTLRVSLATVNGFAFATGIPLVGVNGLEGLIDEKKHEHKVTIALLNAFAQELYYAIHVPQGTTLYGYAPAEHLITTLADTYKDEVLFLGNGAHLYKDSIEHAFAKRALIDTQEIISLESIAQRAYHRWKNKETSDQLMPIYLKGSK